MELIYIQSVGKFNLLANHDWFCFTSDLDDELVQFW